MTENTARAGLTFRIDNDLCSGHGRCYTLAPESFDTDDIGYGEVKDGVRPLSERAAMEDVAHACPEGAISVIEA